MIDISSLYQPQPKQLEFHNSLARNRLQVGGAGSGKSLAMLWEAIRYCFHFPGIQVLLLRKNFPELEKGLIADLRAHVPKDIYRWNDTKHIATIPSGTTESTIHFGHLEGGSDSSLSQYLSSAFPLIGIDELGQFPYKVWEFLSSRNRLNIGCQGNPEPRMMGATNPVGIGWGWIKPLFVDKSPSTEQGGENFDPSQYFFVHSTVFDNRQLLDRNPAYLQRLESMSPAMREKMLYGNMDSVSGAYFTCFRPTVHVVTESDIEWQEWQPIWLGLDWGLVHHTSVLWCTRTYHKGLKRQVTVVYRELLLKEKSILEVASAISFLSSGFACWPSASAEKKSIRAIYGSHELFARHSSPQASQTIAAELSRNFTSLGLPALTRAAGSSSHDERIRGAVMIYEDLAANSLFFLAPCKNLISTIPTLARSETHIEDVQKSGSMEDDIFDSLKHAILSAALDQLKPRETIIREQASKIEDPFARWNFLTKAKMASPSGYFSPTYQPPWLNGD